MNKEMSGIDELSERFSPQVEIPPNVGDLDKIPRKVLLIALDFPPRRTSGVYRPVALTKYLLRFGWQATILTIRGRESDTQDATLLRKIPPEIRVIRTNYLQVNHWENSAAKTARSLGVLRASDAVKGNRPFFSRYLRLATNLLRSVLYFPDETAGWIPFGLAKALRLALAQRFDVIFTTHPPRSAHVIGLLMKITCGIPWVAEFRDPWLLPPGERNISGLKVPASRRNRWLQSKIFRRADALVVVTAGHADELHGVFHAPHKKLVVLTNGFDEEDFNWEETTGPALLEPGYLHLSHFGTVYPGFSGKFFPVLAEIARESPELVSRLRVNIIGFPNEEVNHYVHDGELRDMIRVYRFVEHAEALEAMRSSHGLLLFYGHEYTSRVSVPGKLYEYLRIGRPVLAVAHDGGVQELITEAKAGWVVSPDNAEGIKRALIDLISCVRNVGLWQTPMPEFVARFRYDHLAKELVEVFNKVSASAPFSAPIATN